jgi:cysteine rich repeat protein
MAQADRCVTLPQFVVKSDFKLARGAAIFVAGVLLSASAGMFSSANAQYRGTPEMQQACTPDVMRLCSADIPDVGRITTCLKRNRLALSPACKPVFGVGVHGRHSRR